MITVWWMVLLCLTLRQAGTRLLYYKHGLINLYGHQSKMSSSKKVTWKVTLRQVFICLRHPPLLGFCLGWSSSFAVLNLVRYRVLTHAEYGLLQQDSTPLNPSQPHTACIYCTLTQGRVRGERWTREKVRGAIVHKAGSKISTWLYLQSINSDKHLPQSPFTGQFFRWRHFALVSI
jgi:hypothetical protein